MSRQSSANSDKPSRREFLQRTGTVAAPPRWRESILRACTPRRTTRSAWP